jgi:hypothetical protein
MLLLQNIKKIKLKKMKYEILPAFHFFNLIFVN